MGRADQLYGHLPLPLQHAAITSFGAYWRWQRFGPGFDEEVAGFEARDRFTAEQWSAWQRSHLRGLLAKAATTVPYYRDTWSRDEHRAAIAGALADLPLLPKEPLRADPRQFLSSEGAPRRRLVFSTSGSSGTPIDSYWTPRELRRSMALREVRSARWAGVSFSMPRATFHGRIVVPDADSAGPYHRYNAAEHQIYLSAFHIGIDTAATYADAFRRHHVRWGTGYAVSFSMLAKGILASGVEPLQLDAIITTSEHLDDAMRDDFRAAFGCRTYEEYSTVENVLFAGECEAGSLHVSPDAGIVEILRDDGTPTDPGEVGEVVATATMRSWQPFIRYRVGDRAAWSGEPCACGRALPVLAEVSGRVEDAIVGPDGRRIAQFYGVFVGLPSVVEGQVEQVAATEFVVRVVTAAGFTEAVRDEIEHRMHQRLGSGADVAVQPVDAIARTAAGKFRAVITLDGADGAAGVSGVDGTATVNGAATVDGAGTEAARVRDVYSRYAASDGRARLWSEDNPGNRVIVAERDRLVDEALDRACPGDRRGLRLLDLGCGRAVTLGRMTTLGFSASRVVGLDLLGDRLADARRAGVALPLLEADATALPVASGVVDVALAQTVFSSIADVAVARRIVDELARVLRPGGVLVWYDLRRDNPRNPDVHGLDLEAVRRLFPGWEVSLTSCTLLPPLARRLGPTLPHLYAPLTSVAPLRTHLVGTLRRPT